MTANVLLTERTDIHKSCKALETIVNAFNDYCQAAEALALVQKKLARSLKDAVGMKATNELVGNALSAAATLLDSLAEVDAKFVKVIDKECEGASSDLKKWFKKLAKEERNHDEKVSAANAKIKQAGLQYEKKAKRKDRDAGEEHTRYVNLLSVVGPEMSQERYNHTLLVTQRHTATLYNVASSVSRAADAEWTRACDCVRKFAPVIGRIGECRAYLEGGWMLNMPDGSGDPDDKNERDSNVVSRECGANGAVDEMGVRVGKAASGSAETDSSAHHSTAPAYTPANFGSSASPAFAALYHSPQSPPSAPPSLSSRSYSSGPPPSSFTPAPLERLNTDSVRSIESLSSFPTPPTHFPLPAMTQLPSSPLAQPTDETKGVSESDRDNTMVDKTSEAHKVRDKPNPQAPLSDAFTTITIATERTTSGLSVDSDRSRSTKRSQPPTPVVSSNTGGENQDKPDAAKVKSTEPPQPTQHQRRDSGPSASEASVQERKVSGTVERSESVVRTNSIVASMRDKWGRGDVSSPALPRERDIPQVPNKVSDLASRYVPPSDINAAPLSPLTAGHASPTSDRSRQVSGQSIKGDEIPGFAQTKQGATVLSTDPEVTPSELNLIRRRRRIEELEDLERREQAQALRAREREIEMQTRHLELERERLRSFNIVSSSGSGAAAAAIIRAHPQHSYSMVNLVPSHSGAGEVPARPISQYGEPLVLSTSPSSSSSTSNPASRPDHAPYCGCQACSASQYSNPHSHVQIVAQPRTQKEKPKGWMRRLSMPVVGNAFSSADPKKAHGIGVGVAGGPQTGGPIAYFEQDSTGGISNVRPRKISFGKR